MDGQNEQKAGVTPTASKPTDEEIAQALQAYEEMLFAARRKMQAFLGVEFFSYSQGGFNHLFEGEIAVSVSRHAGGICDFLREACR